MSRLSHLGSADRWWIHEVGTRERNAEARLRTLRPRGGEMPCARRCSPSTGHPADEEILMAELLGVAMFCTRCGAPMPDSALSCPSCGATAVRPPDGTALVSPGPPPESALTTLLHLTMVGTRSGLLEHFQFNDPSGRPVGETQGEGAFPVNFTLVDDQERVVLVASAERVRGLQFDFLLRDASGATIATMELKSSFMSRKYGVKMDGKEVLLLDCDSTGTHCQLQEVGSSHALASSHRDWKFASSTSTTQIDISEGAAVDHRIVLGAILLETFLSSHRR